MDIIGKVYKDYLIKDYKLDGKSYLIDHFNFGGCCNLFEDNFIFEEINGNESLNYFLICNKNQISKLSHLKKEDNLVFIDLDIEIPTALIFENNNDRTSFIIDDHLNAIGHKFVGKKIFNYLSRY